ncbi:MULTISPECIES: formylglycine-generating enzyme family protein [Bradyrhizobium]
MFVIGVEFARHRENRWIRAAGEKRQENARGLARERDHGWYGRPIGGAVAEGAAIGSVGAAAAATWAGAPPAPGMCWYYADPSKTQDFLSAISICGWTAILQIDLARAESPLAIRTDGMVWIPGGTFRMGSDHHYREEAPSHRVRVDAFWIDRTPVTNARFRSFVNQAGHITVAETAPDPAHYSGALPHMLYAGSLVFEPPHRGHNLGDLGQWWTYMRGANWRRPYGPRSNIDVLGDHPVVHVAYSNAPAYAKWGGKELSTEAEWEFAARGGLEAEEYAWGNAVTPGGKLMANIWQGNFPIQNLCEDGIDRASPVTAFPANGYGVCDMIGNVWECTGDSAESARRPRGGELRSLPARDQDSAQGPEGGSHLYAPNYCRRYRPATRQTKPIDTSTSHLGSRCVVQSPVPSQPPQTPSEK